MARSLGNCIGLADATASRRSSSADNNRQQPNKYTDTNFFEGENYQSIIDVSMMVSSLDIIFTHLIYILGYNIAMDIIKLMKEYIKLLQNHADELTSYSKRWHVQLHKRSSLSSYKTTNDIQIQAIHAPDDHVKLIETRCQAIRKVIVDYRNQVNEMYPHVHFQFSRVHYKSNELKNRFENARSSVQKALDDLRKLRKDRKKAVNAMHKAESHCEDNATKTNENNETRTIEALNKKRDELAEIDENIAAAEEKQRKKEMIYHAKATEIFQQCQTFEKQRLDQIKQVLVNFNLAVHSAEYSIELNEIYQTLITKIENEQNSLKDLNSWAQSHGINIVATTNENSSDVLTTESTRTIQPQDTDNPQYRPSSR